MTETMVPSRSLSVLGVNVSSFESYEHAVQHVGQRLAARAKTFCVAINPEKVYNARQDRQLEALLNGTDMKICDGIGVSLAAGLLHGKRIRRCCGVDLFLALIAEAAKQSWKVFLYGAKPESNEGAYRKLKEKHPCLNIVGRCDGYEKDMAKVRDQINASGAELVFVAMGSPRQEYWIADNKDKVNASFLMGVGGSFDVLSGTAKRAPWLFRKTGTEFFYRLLSNPRRWRRQMALPKFVWEVLKEKVHPAKRPALPQDQDQILENILSPRAK